MEAEIPTVSYQAKSLLIYWRKGMDDFVKVSKKNFIAHYFFENVTE